MTVDGALSGRGVRLQPRCPRRAHALPPLSHGGGGAEPALRRLSASYTFVLRTSAKRHFRMHPHVFVGRTCRTLRWWRRPPSLVDRRARSPRERHASASHTSLYICPVYSY